ncbi:hypothetical protein [Mesorhizobium sp. Mes31]|uniref:hypothetical protein n=1 Tax=Mesorhizobium sp. Mes31 TaxID=2926017 RepID=UPI002118674E|nr:hypothetical protein [Mesorhizobium sp. Mes31]
MAKIRYAVLFVGTAIGTFQLQETACAGNFRDKDSWCKQVATLDGPLGAAHSFAKVAGLPNDDLLRVKPKSVVILSGQTVSDAIANNDFLPDKSNLKIVSYLNPSIKDIDNIKKNQVLFVPSLEIFKDGNWIDYKPNNPVDGFVLDYRLAPKLKNTLQEDSKDIKKSIEAIYAGGGANADEKRILDNYLVKAKKIETPSWTDYTNAVSISDSYITFSQQNNDIAKAIVDAKSEGVNLPGATLVMLESLQQSTPDAGEQRDDVVSVTVNTEDDSGNKIDGLNLRYMSAGAFEIGCDRARDAHNFATPSYNATQVLKRTKWYVWAEDKNSDTVTDYKEIDLTTVQDFTFINKLLIKKK